MAGHRFLPVVAACLLAFSAAAEPPNIAPAVSDHALGGLPYRATVETQPVSAAENGPRGAVATVSYVLHGAPPHRPVTFVFNGGPGASSAYLHLGAMGPRTLRMAEDGGAPAPPYVLDDNPDTWLRFTDLVFIDPVGTGFSRAEGDDDKAFWSVGADVRSVAQTVSGWLRRNGRWGAPLYLAGESYGGFRAAHLARALIHGEGLGLSGLVMVSPALEPAMIHPGRLDVLPWALALPSMVASARAQGRGASSPPLAEVETFALGEYLSGIAAIAPDGAGPEPALIDRVAGLLGLEPEVVRRHHGRVPAWVFAERLLHDGGRSLSLYDGAIAGPDPRPLRPGPDPLLDATRAPLSSAYNAYVRQELKLDTALEFRLLTGEPSRQWNWQGERQDGASDELAEALALTPGLRLLAVHGRTDMVTPYMVTRWVLDRLDLPEQTRARIRLEVLEGGHMMYFHAAQRAALGRIAAAFYGER